MFQNTGFKETKRNIEKNDFELTIIIFKYIGIVNRIRKKLKRNNIYVNIQKEKNSFRVCIISDEYDKAMLHLNQHQKDNIINQYSISEYE